jgi:hypothetical protein
MNVHLFESYTCENRERISITFRAEFLYYKLRDRYIFLVTGFHTAGTILKILLCRTNVLSRKPR